MQMNDCSSEEYQKADAKLNVVYKHLLAKLDPKSRSETAKDAQERTYLTTATTKLKASENAWIKYRDLHCDAAAQLYEGGTVKPLMWASCMRDTTEDRIKEIKNAYENGDWKLE